MEVSAVVWVCLEEWPDDLVEMLGGEAVETMLRWEWLMIRPNSSDDSRRGVQVWLVN